MTPPAKKPAKAPKAVPDPEPVDEPLDVDLTDLDPGEPEPEDNGPLDLFDIALTAVRARGAGGKITCALAIDPTTGIVEIITNCDNMLAAEARAVELVAMATVPTVPFAATVEGERARAMSGGVTRDL